MAMVFLVVGTTASGGMRRRHVRGQTLARVTGHEVSEGGGADVGSLRLARRARRHATLAWAGGSGGSGDVTCGSHHQSA